MYISLLPGQQSALLLRGLRPGRPLDINDLGEGRGNWAEKVSEALIQEKVKRHFSQTLIWGWAFCQCQVAFLSPPVLIHGELLCPIFCLSVWCLSVRKNSTRKKIISPKVWVKVIGQVGQTRLKGHDIGRWAHVNVKLHFLFFLRPPRSLMAGP